LNFDFVGGKANITHNFTELTDSNELDSTTGSNGVESAAEIGNLVGGEDTADVWNVGEIGHLGGGSGGGRDVWREECASVEWWLDACFVGWD
jgi:hypothetical protein